MARTPASMSEKPSAPRGRKPKTGGGTMSASEALKAAEAAIAPPPAKPAAKSSPVKVAAPKAAPVAKVAPVKAAAKVPAPAPSVVKTAPAPAAKITSPSTPLPDGVLVAAATTAVDAAPEPPMPEAAITPEPSVPVSVTKTSPEPIIPQALPAPEPLPELLVEGTIMMNDVIETGKKFAEDTKAKLETVYAGLNEKAKVGVEKSTKALEEMSDMAKGNVEAIVESGKIAAKGMETFGQEAVDYSRKNFEKATASMKSLSSVKTPTEFFQLQSAFLSSTFDEFAKEAAKSSEAMMKLAGEVAQPITARVAVVTDKVKSLAA